MGKGAGGVGGVGGWGISLLTGVEDSRPLPLHFLVKWGLSSYSGRAEWMEERLPATPTHGEKPTTLLHFPGCLLQVEGSARICPPCLLGSGGGWLALLHGWE